MNHMFITGDGRCCIYQYFGYNRKVLIGITDRGNVFGEAQILFPMKADYTLESQQHSISVTISKESLEAVFLKDKKVKDDFHKHVFDNPYDSNRNYVVNILKKIPYL